MTRAVPALECSLRVVVDVCRDPRWEITHVHVGLVGVVKFAQLMWTSASLVPVWVGASALIRSVGPRVLPQRCIRPLVLR